MKEISYTTFSKMVLFFHLSSNTHVDPSHCWPLVGNEWPQLSHQGVLEVAGVSNQTSSIIVIWHGWTLSASLPGLGHTYSPKGQQQIRQWRRTGFSLGPQFQAWLSVGDMLGDEPLRNQLSGVSLGLAWLVLLLWAQPLPFPTVDFLGIIGCPTFIAFFFAMD